MDQPMITRRRSGSLELDYGDDPLQDQDQPFSSSSSIKLEQQDEDSKPRPIATLEIARKELVESTRPSLHQPRPSSTTTTTTTSNLPSGLPANPLTGRVPSTGPTPGTNMSGSVPGGVGGAGGHNNQMTAVFISDMHWWTSDQHLVELCHLAGAGGVRLKDVSFSEHKVNGKSKGVAYIETGSAEAAALVKRYVDSNEYQQKRMTCTLVIGSNLGSPFRTLPREPHSRQQGGGGGGGTHNPANQSSRPGLRIPPPCTYPYINSKDNGGSQSTGGGGAGQKRGFGNGPGQGQGMGQGMGGGMTMTGQPVRNQQQQQQQQNYPIQSNSNNLPPQPIQQQQQQPQQGMMGGMGGFGGMDPSAAMAGMGGMNMFGMNPFATGGSDKVPVAFELVSFGFV
ncbi:RNA-binding protein [Sporobolomyces salmoneus]|uniref:RNA-binding protein n=1 Tax=Sporobolomyces salmoneus TaxID=183962 RepID=UPI0031740AC6